MSNLMLLINIFYDFNWQMDDISLSPQVFFKISLIYTRRVVSLIKYIIYYDNSSCIPSLGCSALISSKLLSSKNDAGLMASCDRGTNLCNWWLSSGVRSCSAKISFGMQFNPRQAVTNIGQAVTIVRQAVTNIRQAVTNDKMVVEVYWKKAKKYKQMTARPLKYKI